ncbi:MAG TPA: secondary thiamine-phosphate synthase enzyme YjbQ [Geobacterales bacterium]|nr:secondary thiamine-phosphate synthase enzyme YjbQ [Geobacterales bacterium]
MKIISKTINIATKQRIQFIDITNELEKFVKESGVRNGICLVHVPHATAALILNENEIGLIEDFKRKISELFPMNAGYLHDRIDDNAYAHLASGIIGTSKIFPIVEGELVRGTWQNLLLTELDGPRSSRKVIFQVMGE